MLFKLFALLALGFVTVQAQSPVNWLVLADDPSQMNLISQFVCIYKDDNGNAEVIMGGGRYANNNGNGAKVFSFPDSTQTGIISPSMFLRKLYTTPSTNWVYLTDSGTTNNVDYVQIEVVSSTFTGDCGALQASGPPSGWTSGYPPAAVANGL